MRRVSVLISMLALSAVWAVAQHEFESNPNSTFASRSASYGTTLEGCLDVQSGNYILALPTGSIVHLTGQPEQFAGHVREQVRVSGVMTPVTNVPGTTREATETQPTLSVGALEPISGICRDYNNTR
jgi:hypothetical protein